MTLRYGLLILVLVGVAYYVGRNYPLGLPVLG